MSPLQERLISDIVGVRSQVEEKFGSLRNSRGFIHLLLGVAR
jgi:hypothetical protein